MRSSRRGENGDDKLATQNQASHLSSSKQLNSLRMWRLSMSPSLALLGGAYSGRYIGLLGEDLTTVESVLMNLQHHFCVCAWACKLPYSSLPFLPQKLTSTGSGKMVGQIGQVHDECPLGLVPLGIEPVSHCRCTTRVHKELASLPPSIGDDPQGHVTFLAMHPHFLVPIPL